MAFDTSAAVAHYFATLGRLGANAVATRGAQEAMQLSEALDWLVSTSRATHERGGKLMFVGNGGSASIASHMAIDYSKNGGLRASCFNDGAALTCLSNDIGYENAFAHQILMHGRPGDLLIAISSSGRSANILNAGRAGRERDCRLLTLSGFDPDNPLRRCGDVNLYVDSDQYGFVEITHLALLHAALDMAMGWAG